MSYYDMLKASNLVSVVNSSYTLTEENKELCREEFTKCISYLENETNVKNPHLVGLFKAALEKVS